MIEERMNRLKAIAQVRPKDLAVELRKEFAIQTSFSSRKPVASYIGWTGQGNLGDEILMQAHQKLFSEFEIAPYRPSNFLQSAGKALISSPGFQLGFLGGGTLINQSSAWLDRIKDLQNRKLPVFCMGGGVTPVEFQLAFENTNLSQWGETLETLDFVGLRGPDSAALLAEVGFAAPITGDPALALAPLVAPPAAKSGVVGINIGLAKKTLLHKESDQYVKKFVSVLKVLVAQGHQIRLLPVCQEDLAINREIEFLVANSACSVRVAYDTLENYNLELEQCTLFIGQKLHATVMATLLRIPSIMVEYQPKCHDYMASIGMQDCVIKTSDFDESWVLEKLEYLSSHEFVVRAELDFQVLKYRKLQHRLASRLSQSVLEVL
jgi:polysaccharide pyruvyl transferase WcaK-like protein